MVARGGAMAGPRVARVALRARWVDVPARAGMRRPAVSGWTGVAGVPTMLGRLARCAGMCLRRDGEVGWPGMAVAAGEASAGGQLDRDPHQEALDRVGEVRLTRALVAEHAEQCFVEV